MQPTINNKNASLRLKKSLTLYLTNKTVLYILSIIFLSSCSEQKNQSELLLIQAQHAIAEQEYSWLRTQFKIDTLENKNKAHGHLYLAQAWNSGLNRDILKAKSHYLAAMQNPELETQSARALIYILKELNNWSEIDLTLPLVHDQLITIEILMQKDLNRALSLLEQVPVDLRDHRYHTLAAQIHFKKNDFSNAYKHTTSAKTLGSLTPANYYINAQSLMQMNQVDTATKAMQIFTHLKSLNESTNTNEQLSDLKMLYQLDSIFNQNTALKLRELNLLMQLKQTVKATSIMNQIDYRNLKSKPQSNFINILLANQAYQQISSTLLPIDHRPYSAQEHLALCISLVKINAKTKALNFCEMGMKNYPQHGKMSYWYAMVLYLNQQQQLADKKLHEAIKYLPWKVSWRIQLAESLLSQGLTSQAKTVLHNALDDENQTIKHFKRNNGLY